MAVASSLVFVKSRKDEPPPVEETPRLEVGYYAQDATLTGTGDDGHVLYRVSASRVVQAPSDGSVNLLDVAVDYAPAQDVPWRLTAETGRIPQGDKMIELSGHVVAVTREAGSPAATVRTDRLEFDPTTSVATTDRKVVIEYDGSTLHGTGMRALLREQRVELLSGVSGHYVR